MEVTRLEPRPHDVSAVRSGWTRRRRVGPAGTGAVTTRQQAEDLWDSHGRSAYALALALLGDETTAMRAVALGMTDFARSDLSTSADEARRSLARHVYWRSTEVATDLPSALHLPQPMVWLAQLARLQRTCLALCVFGGLDHQQAAGLLDLSPLDVARLITSGLQELGRLSSGDVAVGV